MSYHASNAIFTLIGALTFIGIFSLIIYIVVRIIKHIIKFTIKTYFEERRLDMLYRGTTSQSTSTPPSYQPGSQGKEHQE